MPRAEKENIVSELSEKIAKAKSILLTDFTGLNVAEISELRNLLHKSSVEYRIVKNTLARLSAEQSGLTQILNYLEGPTAIAFGLDDPLAPAKVISKFAKENNKPTIKAFILEGQEYQGAQVVELSKLPDQQILLAQLVGTISRPISNLVSSLQNLLQQMVLVLSAIKEKKE